MSSDEGVPLSIPKALYDRLKARSEGTEFRSVTDYVVFILEEVVKDEDTGKSMESEDEERVKENLRALGYI